MLAVRFIEDGFVVPASLRAQDPTAELTFRAVAIAGLEQLVQYVVADVGARELAVILASQLDDAAISRIADSLATHFARPLVFVREDREGWARAECADATLYTDAAAAVAVMKASFSWDESLPIVIEIGEQTFYVTPEFRDRQWFADVRDAA